MSRRRTKIEEEASVQITLGCTEPVNARMELLPKVGNVHLRTPCAVSAGIHAVNTRKISLRRGLPAARVPAGSHAARDRTA